MRPSSISRLRHRRLAGFARRLRDERQRHHRGAREVVAGLLVGDVDQLAEAPLGREHRQRRLHVDAVIARADGQRVRFGRRQARFEVAVDEQAPDLLVGDGADEVLDVDAAVAQRAAVFVGLGDLGGEGDDAFEARLDLSGAAVLNRAHGTRFLGLMLDGWLPCGQAHIVARMRARVGCEVGGSTPAVSAPRVDRDPRRSRVPTAI